MSVGRELDTWTTFQAIRKGRPMGESPCRPAPGDGG